MRSRPGEYFALVGRDEIASRLVGQWREYCDFLSRSGRLAKIRKSFAIATGGNVNDSGAVSWAVVRGGDQGELINSQENHYRNIGNNLINIITAQRPAIQASASNTDYRSLSQTLVADGIIEQHLTERKLESKLKRGVKSSVFGSEGFVLVEWDATSGDEYAPDPDAFMSMLDGGAAPPAQRTGEVKITNCGPLDVAREVYADSWDSLSWLLVRTWASRSDLEARFPELADGIRGTSLDSEADRLASYGWQPGSSDVIPLFKFFHKRTPAVPDGRLVEYLGADIVLYDGPNPYAELPVYRVTPDEMEGTPFGDTHLFDLLGPQDVVNAIDSTIVTNELGRGIGNMLVPRNANVSIEAISSSMNEVKYDGQQKPEPMQWPSTPSEFFEYRASKVSVMETLSGVNSVVRGSPSEAIGADASGAKLALIAAQATQSNNALEQSYTNFVRDVCLAIIKTYHAFGGSVPRLVRMVGKSNAYMVKEFTAEDLGGIDRVRVDVGSPMLRTTSGKITIADKLVEMGVIKSGEQYLMLIKAGTYEPAIEGEQAQQLRIRGENERLMDGGFHRALISDPHWLEITQHLTILDNPALREPGQENEAIQAAVLEAAQEHLDLFRSMDPALVMMRGGQLAMEMWNMVIRSTNSPGMPDGGAPVAAATQVQQGTTQPSADSASAVMNAEASRPDMPGMPSMPTRPDTGETYETPGGAIQ